ncbi:TrkH family potassium uptake protein [Bacteroidales bacterium]|nr:TrkH family potassium uptake protein [Bacteroidales bacterium]
MINHRIIIQLISILTIVVGIFMAICAPVSWYYHEHDAHIFLISAAIAIGSGSFGWLLTKNAPKSLGKREGYIIVSISWIFFSLFGALPYIFSESLTSYTDAFFETISGFTTTGATILNDIEGLSHGLLFWRSLTQWLGGMGIIVLSLAILPVLGIGGMQLFIAEVPGPTPDKLHPKIKETAKRLWVIYLTFTLLEVIFLLFGGMSLYDAVCHSFTTMATGGYSTKQDSVAAFSPYIQYVITFFMFIAGVNFTLAYFALHLRFKTVWQNEEFRFYTYITLFFTTIITIGLLISTDLPVEQAFRDSIFQVVSIITTTGFGTADYLKWAPFLTIIIFSLMMVGGSAGSTGGGPKVVRVLIMIKYSFLELKRLVHPNAVIPVRFNGNAIPTNIITNILAFMSVYLIIYFSGVAIIGSMGFDAETSLGAVAATIGNIGPGLGSVGPIENYAHFPWIGKWILSFLMLIGRLELFTVLVLLSPSFWKQ